MAISPKPKHSRSMDRIVFDAFEHAQKSRLTDTDLRPEESTVLGPVSQHAVARLSPQKKPA